MRENVYCEHCVEKGKFYKSTEEVTRKVKDLTITLKAPVPRCMECKNEVFAMEVDEEVQKMFFDEYRKQKGLVSVEDITKLRSKLGVSQRDMAKLLGLGEITIARYELGSIPTKASSIAIESIRDSKNIKSLFESNKGKISKKGNKAIQLYLEKTDPAKYTGNRQYSIEKFSELTAFIVGLFKKNGEKLFVTKLNKILFYTEFNYHNKFGKSISGTKFRRLSYGPVPKYYSYKYDMNPYLLTVPTEESVTYELVEDIEFSKLSKDEMTIAQAVYKHFEGKNGKYISNASHEEDAWTSTEEGEDISYDMSETLKITV